MCEDHLGDPHADECDHTWPVSHELLEKVWHVVSHLFLGELGRFCGRPRDEVGRANTVVRRKEVALGWSEPTVCESSTDEALVVVIRWRGICFQVEGELRANEGQLRRETHSAGPVLRFSLL